MEVIIIGLFIIGVVMLAFKWIDRDTPSNPNGPGK